MKRLLLVMFASACINTTGGTRVTYDVTAQGVGIPNNTLVTGLGWNLVLTQATLHVGAVYMNLDVANAGTVSGDLGCILPGIYTGEELAGLDVDVLSSAPQLFPVPGDGTDDEARTGEVWLTGGGDINASDDPTIIAQAAGTATKGAIVIPFTAQVTISAGNRGIPASDPALPSQHPICKQRIVSPIPIDLRPHDGATLAITVDTSQWFANVDFTQVPPDGAIPDDNSNSASQNLFSGLRAATVTFQMELQ